MSHATGDQGNWAIQLRYIPGKGAALYQLGAMYFLETGSLADLRVKEVDFSYVEVPSELCAYRQEVASLATIKSEIPITVHNMSFEEVPQCGVSYGFCGIVFPTYEEHFGQFCVGGEPRVYSGLTYLRTEDDYHVFSLPFEHPGHKHFEGCSGAPVVSEHGGIVGLVCGGDEKTKEVWAVSTNTYKVVIDVLIGNIAQAPT